MGTGPWPKRCTKKLNKNKKSYSIWRNDSDNWEQPRRVLLTLHTHRRRRQEDYDNYVASLKPVIDAITRAGWLVDDSRIWVDVNYEPEETLKGGDPRVVVRWEALECET